LARVENLRHDSYLHGLPKRAHRGVEDLRREGPGGMSGTTATVPANGGVASPPGPRRTSNVDPKSAM
jgi:hypothetical protein